MLMWLVLLYAAGLILLLAEAFVPGGICGLIGAILIALSAGLGFHELDRGQAGLLVLGELVGAVITVVVSMTLLTRTRAGRWMTLETTQRPEDGYVNMDTDHTLVGKLGVVMTALRPAGTVVVGERRIDAVSQGVFIEEGAHVRVVETRGNRVVVDRVD